ncbi:hypothetical protein [Paraflavitalea sp. CAU 1676]|uniref:hypothetical protein n=1 Tax=Paraflavitalea sp. CAU 1676 TaxID=3032598 RepID=UPI0023DB3519|nr:hypothetical protein [Paraflavitalea sp. CAU 1676]MDF2191295.1 hypothetical protein [Paraflavitalea sp. CAU 1676]
MNATMEDYCYKLINKVLFANSQDEVKRYIDAAIKSMQTHNINGHIIARFVDKALMHLNQFSPMDFNAVQWINIKMAILQFNQLKRSLNSGNKPAN